jgi:hypothetical protein
MADEYMFLAHRLGFAVHCGKQLGNQWHGNFDGLEVLSNYLIDRSEYWDYYGDKATEDPFVLLYDGMGGPHRGFNVDWTTPSGKLWRDEDYVDGKRLGGNGIFRVVFL